MSKILINLRVTTHSAQGGRKYMEDVTTVRFKENDDGDVLFGYFAVFDGHGGPEAAKFCSKHLLDNISNNELFWSEDDEDIKSAIKAGFLETHNAMWKDIGKWPKTISGYHSTAGTTASIGIVKHKKLYIAHVGDSAIVIGSRIMDGKSAQAFQVTQDHKPDTPAERARIESAGGAVAKKSGVDRVVWHRPKVMHQGPVRRSTEIESIPFLAVARSLGDLWSYNYEQQQYSVSPEPDIAVLRLDTRDQFCLIIASDGLWNMVSADEAVKIVLKADQDTEETIMSNLTLSPSYLINPSVLLVKEALKRWSARGMRADNTSCITVMLDPPGPPKASVYRRKRKLLLKQRQENDSSEQPPAKVRRSHSPARPETCIASSNSAPPKLPRSKSSSKLSLKKRISFNDNKADRSATSASDSNLHALRSGKMVGGSPSLPDEADSSLVEPERSVLEEDCSARALLSEIDDLQRRYGSALAAAPARTLQQLQSQLRCNLQPRRTGLRPRTPTPTPTAKPSKQAESSSSSGDTTPVLTVAEDVDTSAVNTTLSRLTSFFEGARKNKVVKHAKAFMKRITRSRSSVTMKASPMNARKRVLSDNDMPAPKKRLRLAKLGKRK